MLSTTKAKPKGVKQSTTKMSTSSGEDVAWVKWFCALKGNEFLVEVDEDYIQDKFNLTGLNEQVPHFKRALEVITDMETDDESTIVKNKRTSTELVEQAAELLYELIHARFLTTPRGITLMAHKYKSGNFGQCPRLYCHPQNCLPLGLSDIPGEETVKLYCPKCRDVFIPRSLRHQQLDGAYFGTGFPHLLFLSHPDLRPDPPVNKYTPKIYGFKIHPLAYKVRIGKSNIIDSVTTTTTTVGGNVNSNKFSSNTNTTAGEKRRDSMCSNSCAVVGGAGAGESHSINNPKKNAYVKR